MNQELTDTNKNTLGDDPLLKIGEIRQLLGGISETHAYRLIKQGVIPRPIKLGRSSYWRRSALEQAVRRLEQND